jgi:tetratricopeptide (TPR) repeat protein
VATPQERKFAFSYVERGKQFVAAKQYSEALEALREAVRRDPTRVEAWILLASVHYTLGEDIECLGAAEEALKHNPSSGAQWNYRGLALERLKRNEEAVDAFARAMRIEGWFVAGAQNTFNLLFKLDRFDEALSVADALLAQQWNNGNSFAIQSAALLGTDTLLAEQRNNGLFLAMRSASLRGLQRYDEAYSAASEAVRLAPEDGYAWFQFAATLFHLRRYSEALEADEREVKLRGVSSHSWWLKSNILTGLRQFEEAFVASQETLTLDPQTPSYWNQVGLALLRLGRPAEAYKHFLRASALTPQEPAFSINAGAALAHLRKFDQALAWTDRALALRADYFLAVINRADALFELGRYEEAEAQLDVATEVTVGHSGYWAAKGSLHTRRGEYDEALVAIKRAIDLSDDDDSAAVAYERMGELLIALEDYPRVLEFAEHGLELRPYDFWLQELKAKALRGLGRESEADEIERAVQARLAEQLALLDQTEGL